jgi:hypothetical protein
MKNATLPARLNNEITIDTFVTDIHSELSKSTNAWKRVAEIFAAAQEQFGRQSKEMTELGKKTGFTKSKIDKLVQIANDKRIKANSETFSTVSAWTVLYDVTLLDTKQFKQLTQKLESGETLTSKLITSIRKPKIEQEPAKMQGLATIQMDINAIRSGLLDQDDYEELISTLEELATRIPFIKITMNDILSKDIENRYKELDREFDRIVRRVFTDERKKYLNRIAMKSSTDYMKTRKKEVMSVTNNLLNDRDFKAAFEYIESDQFDEASFRQEAEQKMWERRETKFKDRVTEPFQNTNLIMLNKAA